MTTLLQWNGVRMRVAHVAADPDDLALRSVTLPASWEDEAAIALLQLSGASGALRLPVETARWLDRLQGLPAFAGEGAINGADEPARPLGSALADALLQRQLAPTASLWQGQADRRAGFVLNLAAFVHEGDFSGEAFVSTVRLACVALRRLHAVNGPMLNGELPLFDMQAASSSEPDDSGGPAGTLLLTNLDSCLALMGLDYDSEAGRDAACYLCWLTTSLARQGAGPVPLPPVSCPIPGLEVLGRQIRDEMEDNLPDLPNRALIETGFSVSGPVDALLGVESCGLAPIFSPLRPDGHLRISALSRLAHRGLSIEAALAAAVLGDNPLPVPGPDAHLRMHRALTGFVDRMPARPDPRASLPLTARLERGARRPLPARRGGFTQRAAIGGHRLYLRTGEYEDGSLGEISLTPGRESSMVRGLLESVGQAVTIGLQHGAPLGAYVEQFAHTRFGPAGTVEGDPVAAYASSLLDYAFRALSDSYLGKRLPDSAPEDSHPIEEDPMLPLDIPGDLPPRERGRLRLVS
ncbi:TSCPD domain-containing protein [Asaia astilbis]|uniref:TSCPD domain-containing protein n=1 Tax=Asaia astilbis TaxID=610244 RepID=UPI00046F30D6|nr:vitamin B12-dependent ribonucleotide reductase [Asaia astilbis]